MKHTIAELKYLTKLKEEQLLDIAVLYESNGKMDAIKLLRAATDRFNDIGEAAKVTKLIYESLK